MDKIVNKHYGKFVTTTMMTTPDATQHPAGFAEAMSLDKDGY